MFRRTQLGYGPVRVVVCVFAELIAAAGVFRLFSLLRSTMHIALGPQIISNKFAICAVVLVALHHVDVVAGSRPRVYCPAIWKEC